jgi:Bacterial HORMA domain 2/TIR domain
MAASDAGASRIFISYRRADAGWPARWLADRLAGRFGAGVVFQDVDSIRPGDDFAAAIEAAVGACAVLLAVIGPHWLAAEGDTGRRLDDPQDWVRLEIEAAVRRAVRVIPVLVDGARMPSASELPPSLQGLARRQAVALSPASLDTRSLVSVLETALASRETGQQQTRTRAPESPHVMARSYTYMANEINRVFLEAIVDFGLDPGDFVENQRVIENGLRTWLLKRQIKVAYLEVYEDATGRRRSRIDLHIEFRQGGDERYETGIDTVRSAIAQAGRFPGCKYRVVVTTTDGAAKVEGWSDPTLGWVDHLRSYDIGWVIGTASVGASMSILR